MNRIKINDNQRNLYTISELQGRLKNQETAFVGKCGNGPDNSLYLIAYRAVILAENPNRTWTSDNCSCFVNRFVDIEITEKH